MIRSSVGNTLGRVGRAFVASLPHNKRRLAEERRIQQRLHEDQRKLSRWQKYLRTGKYPN